ncbi:uncharacterized protein PV09_00721 [Verruconis gallopava]|uniref:Major facilitator superfamily (MFS) profile domain-containing protein n=1 Tax=Verruconis gallopava TaxID=253628 RepID=A0A0D1Y132_9PEZI|nr:uncharacterized protein PV09_00721 [Verruconis gallopava]KIW08786.1 hypothetical protein PV09_00721 [Verruconis gallopava]
MASGSCATMDGIETNDVDTEGKRRHSSTSSASIQSVKALQTDVEAHVVEQPSLSRQISRISSRLTPNYPPKVPRNERRGLFARFSLVPEVTQPVLYPRKTKWVITTIVALAAFAAPVGSAIVMPCLTPISKEFKVSPTVTNLSVALYMLSMSIFPLWWSSFSETLGRRTIYVASFVLFTLFSILSAVASSIGMLIAMRMLSGGAAASVQAVGAGTIADIWERHERGRAMGLFYLGPLCGPLLGPIIGGALAQGLNWRATQWFTAIYGGAMIVMITFSLPETLKARKSLIKQAKGEADAAMQTELAVTGEAAGEKTSNEPNVTDKSTSLHRTTTRQSVAKHSKSTIIFLKRAFIDPLKIILLLRFPAVAITIYYASVTFGALFFLNISIEDTFSRSPYNFSVLIVGLCYIPGSLGYFITSIFGGRWLDYIMKREARKAGRYDANGNLIFTPEDRMKENAWIAAFVYPCALMWYGWSAQAKVHWIVPFIANFFFGSGTMMVFTMASTMLTEFVPKRASTGLAVQNFVRNIFSCVGGIIAHPVIHAIGNGWMCTILGLVSLISGCVVIWSMKSFGHRWREEMEEKLENS